MGIPTNNNFPGRAITSEDIIGKPGTIARCFHDLSEAVAEGRVKVQVRTQWQDEEIARLKAEIAALKRPAHKVEWVEDPLNPGYYDIRKGA